MNKCSGKSVGGICEDGLGRVLMLYRRYEPYGWACPAGHIEEGESPEQALLKEYDEETGLEVRGFSFAFDEFVLWNNCHRSNSEGHHWWVYKIFKTRGEVKISEEETRVDEKTGLRWGWFSPEEIGNLDLEPVWKYFLRKLRYLPKTSKKEGIAKVLKGEVCPETFRSKDLDFGCDCGRHNSPMRIK